MKLKNIQKVYLFDATKQPLGRFCSEIATILRGKNDPNFAPNVVSENIVVVINAKKVWLTGTKELSKQYFHHTNYPGGIKMKSFETIKANTPKDIIVKAVRGMLPKNRLTGDYLKHLKIYSDSQHTYIGENYLLINK